MSPARITSRYCIDQLAQHLRREIDVAGRAEHDARDAARNLATEAEKKEDGRAMLEFGSLATGQAERVRKARQELSLLASFANGGVPSYGSASPVGLGAVVDISVNDERGCEERTVILLPVGAGTELTGPDGDGFLTVVTPASPVGRALMGKLPGDGIEIGPSREAREWTILEVG